MMELVEALGAENILMSLLYHHQLLLSGCQWVCWNRSNGEEDEGKRIEEVKQSNQRVVMEGGEWER